MRHINRLILLILLSSLLPVSAYAIEASGQASNVFKFQQKLADKGNARAQYKLACMYEAGTGIARDIDQAKHWYNKAATAGIKAASDRITYLSVKQRGYDKSKDSAWLDGIKKDAKASKGDAMFLLAQLYREGIGVKKDLNRSLEILDQVSLLGAADVEDEMALIQQEIDVGKKARKDARKKRKMELARIATQEKEQQLATQANIESEKVPKAEVVPAKKVQKTEQVANTEDAVQAAKIARYKKAMMQLKLEQQKIDEQQAWAAGGKEGTVDDEI